MTTQPEPRVAADAVPERRLDARVRKLPGKILVGGPRQVLELEDTATFVWNHIDGERTVADIGRALAAEYDIDEDTATRDVAEFVGDLLDVEVVEVHSRS